MRLVAFQHKAEMVFSIKLCHFCFDEHLKTLLMTSLPRPPLGGADSSATTIKQRVLWYTNETDNARIDILYCQDDWTGFIESQHRALSLAIFWYWDKELLVGFLWLSLAPLEH